MILCCGEALIDMLPATSREGKAAFVPHPGGAVFNTAVALGRLGAPAGFFSGLSTDLFGRKLVQALESSKVDTRHARFSARPTTLAFVELENGQASYLFYDEGTAGRMLSESDLPMLGEDVEAMLFGAISLIGEPCGSAYESLMRRERDARVIMLDPNIRPAFIPDPESHRRRLARMIAMADIVKVSDEDLAWFGESADAEKIALHWLNLGPSLVVVTRGKKGVTAFSRARRVDIAAPTVAVVDTVGAGDTFNAGLLASLHEQGLLARPALKSLSETATAQALSLGVGAAAVTVSRAGANPPWRHELA